MLSPAEEILNLHRQILYVFNQSDRVAYHLCMRDYPISTAIDELEALTNAVALLPDHLAIRNDLRFMAFRRARILMKAPGESAVILEPPDYVLDKKPDNNRKPKERPRLVGVISQHPSYHDAALEEARRFVQFASDAWENFSEERRNEFQDYQWQRWGIPKSRQGCHAELWTRLDAIVDEYNPNLLGEASLAVEPKDYHLLLASPSVSPDGPCGVYQWRFHGEVTADRMQPKPHKLAERLWSSLGGKVSFADLIGPRCVFEDDVSDATIAKHGSNANTWFRSHKIPLKISSSTADRSIWMTEENGK